MTATPDNTTLTTREGLAPAPVNVRIKLSALWTTTLLVFAFVDIFGLYREDVRAELDAGTIAGFAVGQGFLLATTAYIIVPALMVIGSLVLRAEPARLINVILAAIYIVTIAASAIGEWGYFILGSVVEVALLAAVIHLAYRWPRADSAV